MDNKDYFALKPIVTEFNKDIIQLTNKILDQNRIIIESNAKLLEMLSSPMFALKDDQEG